jgi:ABC-type proline/glycine betaine transport system substrate-binding protein
MAYLIFESKEEAQARSEQAGIAKGLSYHKTGSGSRYWWGVSEEAAEENPRAYIEIKKFVWTNEETNEVHTNIPDENLLNENDELLEELPEDWVYSPDPMEEPTTEEEEEDATEEPPLVD